MTTQAAHDSAGNAQAPAQIGRVVFIAFLGLAAIAWIGIAVGANARMPGIVGMVTAIFGGFFLAVLIAAIGGWIALKLSEPYVARRSSPIGTEGLGPEMSAILFDLESEQQEAIRQVKERSAWRVPACAAVGLCIWTLLALAGAPGGAVDFVVVMLLGAIAGYVWSSREQSREHAAFYTARILPRLAASFGEITWRRAVMPDLNKLREEQVFPTYVSASAGAELAGTYRGLAVHIVELKLDAPGDGKKTETAFDGLLIDISLKHDAGAAILGGADGGAFGNFSGRMTANSRPRVALDDPEFERVYQVHSPDADAARALLHPALRQALLRLARLQDFGAPALMASGRRLVIAAPKVAPASLFAAPGYAQADASRNTLLALREDIAAVLAVADAAAE
jgi:Protein of unknown function (DUF3137)